MSMTKYRAFVHTVELGSLTRAAEVMQYSQPGISKMMDSLEDELNLSLFVRKGPALELTENGKQIYIYCKDIVRREDELINAANAMNGLLTGTIRIGALNSIILEYTPNVIKTYSNAHPIIQIFLDELSYAEIIDDLKNGTIDIGFTSKFSEKSLDFIPLFKDPIRLIVNKDHPLASCSKIPISALDNSDFISLPPGGDDLLVVVRNRQKFTPINKYYVHSDAAAVAMVSARLGVYIISEMQCRNLPDNVIKKEFEEDLFRVMGIGIKYTKNVSPTIKEMIRISKLQEDPR